MSGGKPASLDDTMPVCLATEAASSADVNSSVGRHGFSTFTCVVSHGTIPSLSCVSANSTQLMVCFCYTVFQFKPGFHTYANNARNAIQGGLRKILHMQRTQGKFLTQDLMRRTLSQGPLHYLQE